MLKVRTCLTLLCSLFLLIFLSNVSPASAQCTDNDGDGYNLEVWCAPVDCDDNDPNVYPGAPEICDGKDSNCDYWKPPSDTDNDGDGVPACAGDCNDNDATAYPGAPELCGDGIDNNCNWVTDEPGCICPDADGDGFTAAYCGGTDCDDTDSAVHQNCAGCTDNDGDGIAAEGGSCGPVDCDDSDPNVHPGAAEICDGKDNNCDGWKPPTDVDSDGDDVPLCANDCNDNDPSVYPGAAEQCDGKDNNCDYIVPLDERDLDNDGYLGCDTDCDDNDPLVNPGFQEFCADGKDNNCDGQVDEAGCICPDNDGDGFTASYCGGTDCDDSNATVFPGAAEECTDGLDNDCDGLLDCADPDAVNCPPITDADGDGYDVDGICGEADCDDNDPDVHPGAAEVCDGKDSDCDGWKPPTDIDNDMDGFAVCAGDCNDNDPDVNPGVLERHFGDAICGDGIDNDCDYAVDGADSGCAQGICSTRTKPEDPPHFFTLLNSDDTVHPESGNLVCNKCHAADFNDPIRLACQRCHVDPTNPADPLNGTIKAQYPLDPPYGYGTAPDVAMHSSAVTGSQYGNWTMGAQGCVTCHNPHTQEQNNVFGTTYGMYIKEYICYDNDETGGSIEEFVELTSATGAGSFTDGPPQNENVCEICHTRTNHHRNDGLAPGDLDINSNYIGHYDGERCTDCHIHTQGFKPSCGACHGVPPQTGSHLKHFGGTKDDAGYGNTDIARDVTAQSSTYLFNCGNCHPMDSVNHINGVLNSGGGSAEIELYNPDSPAGSLKALNPPAATYTPGATVLTDAFGLTYTEGTCDNVYCHSVTDFSTSGPVPEPTPYVYPLEYSPPWQSLVLTSTVYQSTLPWGTDTDADGSMCNNCHGMPITTSSATVSGGAGDTHQWIGDSGYGNLHAWNMSFDPVQCSTCHHDTVTADATWMRDASDITYYDDVPIFNAAKHVNGMKDVAFTPDPVLYQKSGGDVFYDLTMSTFDPDVKTCSDIGCHQAQTEVTWGSPYRWWNSTECNVCHRM